MGVVAGCFAEFRQLDFITCIAWLAGSVGLPLMPKAKLIEPVQALPGLDLLRIIAILGVTIQHACSLTGHDNWTSMGSVNVGQFGVALFLGISAYLCAKSARPPVVWLAARLKRLYPAYWLTMLLCFALVWVANYKTFTATQFISQMLGVGLFTHPGKLINVPTWFISILLVCYLAVFLCRCSKLPLASILVMLALVVVWGPTAGFRWPWLHLLTFFAVYAIAISLPGKKQGWFFVPIGLVVFLLGAYSVAFAYTGLTLIFIGLALPVQGDVPIAARISEYSYEYYLVHGIFLIGAVKLLPHSDFFAVLVGVVCSAIAAVLVRRCVDCCNDKLVSQFKFAGSRR